MRRFFRQLWREISKEIKTFGFWCQVLTYLLTIALLGVILPIYIESWYLGLPESEQKKAHTFFDAIYGACYFFTAVVVSVVLFNVGSLVWKIVRPRLKRNMHVHWSPYFESQEVIQMEPLPLRPPSVGIYFPALDDERPMEGAMELTADLYSSVISESRRAVSSPDIYSNT